MLKYLLLEKKISVDNYTYSWIKTSKMVENFLGQTYLVGEDTKKSIENVYFFQHVNAAIIGKNTKCPLLKV